MNESVVQFDSGSKINGIVTFPNTGIKNGVGVILLNAGFLHKVGPSRIYVRIARILAENDFTVLRFDFSGIGDNLTNSDNSDYLTRKTHEINCAVEFLCQHYKIDKVLLIGICSGADAAFNAFGNDKRISGAILINGYFVNDQYLGIVYKNAQQHLQKRYYGKSILNLKRWTRFVSGKSNYSAIFKYLKLGRDNHEKVDMFDNWNKLKNCINDLKIAIVMSDGSVSNDIYDMYLKEKLKEIDPEHNIIIEKFRQVDHLFTLVSSQDMLVNKILYWLKISRIIL